MAALYPAELRSPGDYGDQLRASPVASDRIRTCDLRLKALIAHAPRKCYRICSCGGVDGGTRALNALPSRGQPDRNRPAAPKLDPTRPTLRNAGMTKTEHALYNVLSSLDQNMLDGLARREPFYLQIIAKMLAAKITALPTTPAAPAG